MRFYFFLLTGIMGISSLFAQTSPCAVDAMVREYLQTNPQAVQRFLQTRQEILAMRDQLELEEENRSEAIFYVPVVFHVIHSGQAVGVGANLSETQLLSQLEALNRDFRKRNADTLLAPAIFKNRIADIRIAFCLAETDPSGNPTSGITRHVYNNTSNFDVAIKPVTQWDFTRYLNIWTTTLTGTLLGYATPPGLFPDNQDGVVLDYRQVGIYPDNPFNTGARGRTCVHEVGHWLGLWHTFQDGCVGMTAGSCSSEGDFICDTPPVAAENFGCPNLANPPNSCNESPLDEPDMYSNYMDYSNEECQCMFTHGQCDVMRATLLTNRVSILSSEGCNSSFTFTFSGRVLDENGNGVSGASVLLSGSSEVQVSTDAGGNFSVPNVKEGYYQVYAGKWGYATTEFTAGRYFDLSFTPVDISIQSGVYYDDFVMDLGWTKFNNAGSGFWERAIPFGTYVQGNLANTDLDVINDFGVKCYVTGNTAVSSPNQDDVDNGINYLSSPLMDLTTFSNPVVTYKRRYYNGPVSGSASDDVLYVRVNNGTQTITLETVSDNNGSNNNWQERSFSLNGLIPLTASMKIQIEAGDAGNQNIVEAGWDQFRVTEGVVGTEESGEEMPGIYPVPSRGSVWINWTGGNAHLEVMDMSGRLCLFAEEAVSPAALDLSTLPQGVYFIRCVQKDKSLLGKLIVQP